MSDNPAHQLDARGLRCPLPLLKLKQGLHGMAPGEAIVIQTTDPGSVRDFQAFLRQSGHELLALEEGDGEYRFHIRKKTGN
ncbi:MAG TPA: sulfurtransferase TusA family protein [Moraxellaceae bacterium]|nr:sulfurtransferase TusA family protein [Moraxellaceae bacterium]